MQLTNHYPSLRNKVVLITGGASGIGASMVEVFCRQLARVVFFDIRDDDARKVVETVETTAAIEGASRPEYLRCDVMQTQALQVTIAQIVQRYGAIDVLINNVGDDSRHDFEATTEDDWNKKIHVNARHAFFAIQAAFATLKRQGEGSIITLGSASWHDRQRGFPVYTMAKAALEGMMRGLVRELGEHNIRINTIIPGWIMTEKQYLLRGTEEVLAQIRKQQSLSGLLSADDVCALALFLASDDSRMCTGQNFVVDGGLI